MNEFEQARVIALTLLSESKSPDDQEVRQAAEVAVRALPWERRSQGDMYELLQNLEASLNLVTVSVVTLTDQQSGHTP